MTDRPTRILHVISSRWHTGPGMSVVALATRQCARGLDVSFSCDMGDTLEIAARDAGLPLVDLKIERKGNPIRTAQTARKMAAEAFDIVHVHRSGDHIAAALACRVLGWHTQIVRTIHHGRAEPDSIKTRLRNRLLTRNTDAIIAVTRQAADLLMQQVPTAADRIYYIPGGVDTDCFKPDCPVGEVPEDLPATPEGPLIGLISKLNVSKRKIDQAIAAFKRLREITDQPFRVVILGDEAYTDPVRALLADAGLADRSAVIHSHGVFRQTISRVDIGVQLVPGSDGACRATLEMMALGRPSVVYATGALPELVQEGQTGLVVSVDKPDQLAEALKHLLAEPELRRQMGAAARQRAEEEFSMQNLLDKVDAVYASVESKV